MFKQISKIFLGITALLAIILTILDLFNLFQPQFSFDKVVMTLLSLLAIYFVSKHYESENQTDEIISKIGTLNNISQQNITLYDDSMEIESALGAALLKANKSVCDLSWKNQISTGFDVDKRKHSHSDLEKRITKSASNVAYREIFVFNDKRRFEKLRRRINENVDGYSCKYFEDNNIPRLQFVIVDDNEVFFFASSAKSPLCSIKDPRVGKIFQAYFEELWDKAEYIKYGSRIYKEAIDKIEEKFKAHQSSGTS
ncbi:hypothetical protein QQ008_06875 [Fulvivirgaceae bacterium BMA10]|uniref:Uncharacterized protein n=1 Tax=Splendidivirga corallicola TaxID=3051826 RepID=A0ABT8KNF2_9BACT|nr:hypothetical protein [Fulvivirgaceae bacterium BMA10]